MKELTVCHSIRQLLGADVSRNQSECLVAIYPVTGCSGLWALSLNETYLGRSPDCDIQLIDESISRRHAAVQRIDDGFMLIDLNSTNGTFVNDHQIKQHLLRAGDQIHLGTHILKYLSADDIERQFVETVYTMSTTDGLTKAFNQQYLRESLQREVSRSRRRHRCLSVAMLDIDQLRRINDSYGHLAGDEVLREFGRRIPLVVHDDCLLARFGGDEFALMMSETDLPEALEVAESIRHVVGSMPFSTLAGDLEVTVSVGVSTMDGCHAVEADQLLSHADAQLAISKEMGRNRVIGGAKRNRAWAASRESWLRDDLFPGRPES